MDKLLKVPLSCRATPQLKQTLEEEAIERGMTTSSYLIFLLKNRNTISTDEDSLHSKINELEEMNEELEKTLDVYVNNDSVNVFEADGSDNSGIIAGLHRKLSLLERNYVNLKSKLKVYENNDYVNVSEANNSDNLAIISGLRSKLSLLEEDYVNLESKLEDYVNTSKTENSNNLVIISDSRNRLNSLVDNNINLKVKLKVYENDDSEYNVDYDFNDFESINIAIETHQFIVMRLEEKLDKIHEDLEGLIYDEEVDYEDDESFREKNSELLIENKKLKSWLSEFECAAQQQHSRMHTYKKTYDS